MTGIALGLLSSLSWGIADFLGGVASRRVSVVTVLAVSQPIGLALALVWVLGGGDAAPPAGDLLLAFGAGAITLGALAAYYAALAIGPIGVVAPIGALGVVIPVVAGIAGGDDPGALQAVGMVLAVAGVVLAARQVGPTGPVSGRAVGLVLLAAAGFGVFLLIVDETASESASWTLAAVRAGGCAGIAAVVLRSRGIDPIAPVGLRTLLAIGLFEMVANGAYALATTEGELSLVSVAGSLYPAVAALLASVILSERLSRGQTAGVVMAIGGVSAIAAGT